MQLIVEFPQTVASIWHRMQCIQKYIRGRQIAVVWNDQITLKQIEIQNDVVVADFSFLDLGAILNLLDELNSFQFILSITKIHRTNGIYVLF